MTDDWWAFESLRESYDNTVDRLMPFDGGVWLRLVVVALIAGGGGGSILNLSSAAVNAATSAGSTGSTGISGGMTASMTSAASVLPSWAGVLAVVVILGIVLGLAVLSSMAMFAFIDMTRKRTDSLRAAFRGTFWPGLCFLGFRIGIVLVFLAMVGVPALLFYLGGLETVGLFVMVPYAILLVLVFSFVQAFTGDVIVVDVFLNDRSFLGSWSRFAGIIQENLADTFVYWVIRFIAGMAGGIISMMAMLFVVIVAVIVFGVSGMVVHMAGVSGQLVALVFGGMGLLVLMAAMAVISMPIGVFMRYYGNNVYTAAIADATVDAVADEDTGNKD